MSEKVWDYTAINAFQTCRRYYYYMMVKHLQTLTKSPALLFGGAIHDALDVYYTEGIDKALAKFRETYKDKEGDDLRTVSNGVKMLEQYAIVYANEPFKVLGKPEAGFVFPLTEDIMWGGRMDLPVEWSGDLWIVEHKTTTALRSNFFRQFDLCKQITGYTVGAEVCYNRKCQGCIVNALEPWKELKRPTAKSKRPEDHFVRNPMPRTKMLKDRFKMNIARIVRDIRWCEQENEFYEAEKKETCFSYNYDCPYKQLCLYGEDERIIKRDYRVEKWEPYKVKQEEPYKAEEVKNKLFLGGTK